MPAARPTIPASTTGVTMSDTRVLVAFASQAGSTAGIATTIAGVLRRSGLAVGLPCRLRGRATLPRMRPSCSAAACSCRAAGRTAAGSWCAMRGRSKAARCGSSRPARSAAVRVQPESPPSDAGECSVGAVARAVGARGSAVFGPIGLRADADPIEQMGPVNVQRVRAWAAEIAVGLRASVDPPGRVRSRGDGGPRAEPGPPRPPTFASRPDPLLGDFAGALDTGVTA